MCLNAIELQLNTHSNGTGIVETLAKLRSLHQRKMAECGNFLVKNRC